MGLLDSHSGATPGDRPVCGFQNLDAVDAVVLPSVELLEELPECEGYFVSKQLKVSKTSGFTVSA